MKTALLGFVLPPLLTQNSADFGASAGRTGVSTAGDAGDPVLKLGCCSVTELRNSIPRCTEIAFLCCQ